MTYIADPIERIDSNIERMIDEVGPGGKCMGCNEIVGFDDLHPVSGHPDSPAFCWGCCVESWGYDPTITVKEAP